MANVHVFIFRRDLRIHDNLALYNLVAKVKPGTDYILPLFIFNAKQIDPKSNKYFNKNSVEFMIQSLMSLNEDLQGKLFLQHTDTTDIDVLESIKKKLHQLRKPSKAVLASVSFNMDYTPFAIQRDEDIQKWCRNHSIDCHTAEDYTLLPINTLLTKSGTFFSVYTPFYKNFMTQHSNVPESKNIDSNLLVNKLLYPKPLVVHGSIKPQAMHAYYFNEPNLLLYVKGGRQNGLAILNKIKQGTYREYDKERDYPFLDKTTRLSAYLKFGCISIREAYHTIKQAYGVTHGLIRELVWREFYSCITFNRPRVLEAQIGKKNLPFREKYDDFPWKNNKQEWQLFVQAKTGFPFIDAGIKMLYATGFCPNRLRMVLAMFATKDLMTDPVIFEKWFAQHLVDYDPSSNSGGVLWSSSTGCDSQPYFRIFSPVLQTQRYDPEALFIKTWIPELASVSTKDILNWDNAHSKYKQQAQEGIINYPSPMLNHTERSKIVIETFKRF